MRHGRHALTLVELLIVLTVIALLAGILFAAMAPVREKGRQVACIGNLKQIYQALTLYRNDYEGGEPDGPMTYSQLGLPPDSAYGQYGNGGVFTSGYVKDARLWICPSDSCTFMPSLHPECRSDPRGCCSSYSLPGFWLSPDRELPQAVAECGNRLPLYFCRHHGMEQGVSSYAIVVRWNGQVKGKYVQLPMTPCLD